MKGTITKISKQGLGIIAGADGSRVPFMASQSGNQDALEPGQSVVFSIRMVNNIAFAQNITVLRRPGFTSSAVTAIPTAERTQ